MEITEIKIGRPYAVNEIAMILLEHALKLGCSVAEACRFARIGRTTYYAELARNIEFAARMDTARRYLVIKARLIIADAILIDRDTKTAKWFLERKDPEYGGGIIIPTRR